MGAALGSVVFRPPAPPSYSDDNPQLPLVAYRNFDNEECHGLFIDKGSPLVILFSHGNAEDLGTIHQSLEYKSYKWGISIFAYEYSGYGPKSSRTADEKNCRKDIDAAFRYLVRDLKFSPGNIIVYGRSLGSGPSCYLASKENVRAVILQSSFTSILGIASRVLTMSSMNMFVNESRIPLINCKILFVHGLQDKLIPVSHALAMYKLSTNHESRCLTVNAGHNNVEAKGLNIFYQGVGDFIHSTLVPNSGYCKMNSAPVSHYTSNHPAKLESARALCAGQSCHSFVKTVSISSRFNIQAGPKEVMPLAHSSSMKFYACGQLQDFYISQKVSEN